jgi:hypothetical protein
MLQALTRRRESQLNYELSDQIKLVLSDGDTVWPTTMNGSFRLVTAKEGHNVLGEGEQPVTEDAMIDGVLNKGQASRWRSRTNEKRKIANHFSIASRSVREVHAKVGGVWVQFK